MSLHTNMFIKHFVLHLRYHDFFYMLGIFVNTSKLNLLTDSFV